MLAIIPNRRTALSTVHWLETLATSKGLAQLQKGIQRFAAGRPITAALIGLGAVMIFRMLGTRR